MTSMMRHRRRRPLDTHDETTPLSTPLSTTPTTNNPDNLKEKTATQNRLPKEPGELSYHVAKFVILRAMAAIYLVAFWGAWKQNLGLMGAHGLVPAHEYWELVQARQESWVEGFASHPSLFWWIPMNDATLEGVYGSGMIVAALVLIGGVHSWVLQLLLWILYFTVVTTAQGTTFYAYGWESQVLETGFLCIFLCDLPAWREKKRQSEPSYMILWLFRWLCFRISMGAGLIKVRGSSCWTEKTCLYHHFETQPIPSPLSFVYHFLPKVVLKHMVDIDLVVQLYTSFFVLLPTWVPYSTFGTGLGRALVRLGGWMQAGFMVGILLSGNFAFLNHLTIIPALACLDDACWPTSLSFRTANQVDTREVRPKFRLRNVLDGMFLLYIGYLSSPVIANLLQLGGGSQVMNASFDPFRLVNTYGAFGSVGEQRYEPIVMVSDDGQNWFELEFPCKPGRLTRQPCFCAPYHYRLDWNIWFIGFKPHKMYLNRREFWLYNLLEKLMSKGNDPRPWLDLLDPSTANTLRAKYYEKGEAPRFAKVDMFHYKMTGPLSRLLYRQWDNGTTFWWNRRFEETLIPTLTLVNGQLKHAADRDEKNF